MDHNIICAAVNQWRTRLRACMRMEGTLNIICNSNSKYLSFELIPTVSIVLVLKDKNITTQEQFFESSLKFYTQCLNEC